MKRLALATLAAATTAPAQTCPVEIGRFTWDPGVSPREIAVRSDTAYVTNGPVGSGALLVLDVSNPASPAWTASLSELSVSYHIDIKGDSAYLGCHVLGFHVVDIASGTSPRLIGSFAEPESTRDVKVVGQTAYTADGPVGLRIVGISDPQRPTTLSVTAMNDARSVDVAAGVAYVCDRSRLSLFDITQPSNPTQLGSTPSSDEALSVVVVGDFAFIAAGAAGVDVVSVSDPADPHVIATLDTPGHAYNLHEHDGLLYVADGTGGLQIVDVTDPASPRSLGNLPILNGREMFDVVVSEGVGYIAGGYEGLITADVSNPAAPVRLATLDTSDVPIGISIEGSFAYLTSGSGVRIADISEPSSPAFVGWAWVPGDAVAAEVVRGIGYVAASEAGLGIIDLTDPLEPSTLGWVDTPDQVFDVRVEDDVACVTDLYGGLRFLDVSDPEAVSLLGVHNIVPPGQLVTKVSSVAVSGHMAVAGLDRFGLQVIDFVNPISPTLAGQLPIETHVGFEEIEIVGEVALVCAATPLGFDGIYVVDLSSPSQPTILARIHAERAQQIEVRGDLAYVAGHSGLHIIDIQQPASPLVLAHWDDVELQSIDVVDDLAFVISREQSLHVLDLSSCPACYADCDNSTGPGVLDLADYLCFQTSFLAAEPYACNCDTGSGLAVCDVFDFLCFQDALAQGCP